MPATTTTSFTTSSPPGTPTHGWLHASSDGPGLTTAGTHGLARHATDDLPVDTPLPLARVDRERVCQAGHSRGHRAEQDPFEEKAVRAKKILARRTRRPTAGWIEHHARCFLPHGGAHWRTLLLRRNSFACIPHAQAEPTLHDKVKRAGPRGAMAASVIRSFCGRWPTSTCLGAMTT